MRPHRHLPCPIALLLLWAAPAVAHADVWSAATDYSITENPHGAWSYGRKWSPTASAIDSMAVRWGDSGWYLGNSGHGGPSIQGYINLWAKDNSNGLPALRWTAPRAGTYSIDIDFTGNDSRGVDVYAFVIVNNVEMFGQRILGNGSMVHYSAQDIAMNSGDTIDLVIQWGGSVYSEYNWTLVSAIIATAPVRAQSIRDEVFYSVDPDADQLVTIDPVTGNVTVVGAIGFDVQDTDLAWWNNQICLADSHFSAGFLELRFLNPTSGQQTSSVRLTLNNTDFAGEGLMTLGGQLLVSMDTSLTAFSDKLGIVQLPGGGVSLLQDYAAFGADMDGLAVDARGRMYGLDGEPSLSLGRLTRITASNYSTLQTYDSSAAGLNDLAFTASGALFAIDHVNRALHKLDPVSGVKMSSISLNPSLLLLGLVAPPRHLRQR